MDFFIVSSNVTKSIISHDVIQDGLCLSDHLPIMIELDLKCTTPVTIGHGARVNDTCIVARSLRWDRADLVQYYATTYAQFTALLNTLVSNPCYSSLWALCDDDTDCGLDASGESSSYSWIAIARRY